ncbi:MAG: phage tail sheath subtilisin-like domain-containing protein [Rhodobiaceae bacterium]|nr:phage tail sheath subtilisin-like domain-containing protein [Rhodobiaceae bacterium]
MYKHPGVYIEHVPSGVLAIEAASTSTAAFIGPVKRGPVGEPVFIANAGQFAQMFGTLEGAAGGIRDEGDTVDKFGHAIAAFYANGGTKAYVVRVAEGTVPSPLTSASTVIPNPETATLAFEVTAASEGAWANDIVVRLTTEDNGNPADLTLGYQLEVGLYQDGSFTALEVFSDLQMASTAAKSIVKVVNDNSTLITLKERTVGGGAGDVAAADLSSTAVKSGAIDTSLPLELVTAGGVPKPLDVTVGAQTAVTVNFTRNSADLKAIAATIQSTVRAGATAPDFTVRVITEGSDRKLLLFSGIRGAAGNVTLAGTGRTPLSLTNGTGATDVPYPPTTLTAGSQLIEGYFTGGADGVASPGSSAYDTVYTTLRDYRDVSIMLLPGLEWIEGGDNSKIENAITHAEFMQNRMVIVDPPDPVGGNTLVSPKDVKDLGAPTSPYTALYYPWLEVSNPYYDPDTAANKPKTFRIPPSSFAAGMWARIDGRRGVWKAPAGLEATVRATIGPNILIGNDLQDNLNDLGVNCLRAIIGPTVIWGARTLATKTKPEYRYIPVRRTQNMIGESLYNALQAVVFEPNDHRLWASLRASVTNFMDGLFRAGAFQGEKASDAYYVLCGLGSTMTQGDIDAGIVRVVVGFAPLKPAEFVVVQIKQIVGQTA